METWFICVNDMWAHARACAYGGLCPHLRPPFILVRKGPKIVLGPCENKRVSNLPFICPIIYNDCICYQIDDALLAQNVNVMNRGCTCVSITSKLLASTHIGYGLWISFASVTLSRMMNLPILYSKMNSRVPIYGEDKSDTSQLVPLLNPNLHDNCKMAMGQKWNLPPVLHLKPLHGFDIKESSPLIEMGWWRGCGAQENPRETLCGLAREVSLSFFRYAFEFSIRCQWAWWLFSARR